jgi:hypothetical protein
MPGVDDSESTCTKMFKGRKKIIYDKSNVVSEVKVIYFERIKKSGEPLRYNYCTQSANFICRKMVIEGGPVRLT